MSDEDFDVYAIGHADSFGVVTDSGVLTIEYDLKQVQDEGFARYRLDGGSGEASNVYYRTRELSIGEDIGRTIVEDMMDSTDLDVYGFVVPDYMLAGFIRNFPDRRIFREQ